LRKGHQIRPPRADPRESGTGKEILARPSTARAGQQKTAGGRELRRHPGPLIESELFGYERGAFTGPYGRALGYFDVAHEGTILLDEIGDASLQSQSKLLRVLEDGCFKRVGGNRNVTVDVRIISATNKNLKNLIAEKAFREDLFYRLNTFTLQLPPLRDRVRDIPLLVEHFISSSANEEHRTMKFLPQAMEILQSYDWPGNVRELKGVVNYAVNMSTSSLIAPAALPSFLFPSGGPIRRKSRYEQRRQTTGGTPSDVLQTWTGPHREAIEASPTNRRPSRNWHQQTTFYLNQAYGLG
jgi:transcriptional regulator with PAS, ATPase and Fis domain